MNNLLNDNHKIIFCFALVLTYLAGIAAPRLLGFLPSIWAIVFMAMIFISTKTFPKPKIPEFVLFGVVLVLGFVSSLWAPDTGFAIERSVKLAALLIPGVFLLAIVRHVQCPNFEKASFIFMSVHALVAFFLISEKLSGHQIIESVLGQDVYSFKLNRSFVVFALSSIPLLLMIRFNKWDIFEKTISFVIVIGLSAGALYVTESQTAQLSFLVGLFFVFVFPVGRSWGIKLLMWALVIFTLFFPLSVKTIQQNIPQGFLTKGVLKEASIVHRLEVWNYAADKALEKPLHGQGIEALRFLKSDTWMEHQKADNALHAHNAVLQIWAEFGLLGAILAICFIIYIFRNILAQPDVNKRRIYLSILMACLSCALTGYGLWQGWQVGMFLMFAVVAIVMANKIDVA
ncbi:MAG: O-antigen ligase family protein [Alphaproteobacteria bacterium]|nr:O-antigen ligase family protein [Alphaproteobacteria bacterium]